MSRKVANTIGSDDSKIFCAWSGNGSNPIGIYKLLLSLAELPKNIMNNNVINSINSMLVSE